MGRVVAVGDNAAMESFSTAAVERVQPAPLADTQRTEYRDRDLDRARLPPVPTSAQTRQVDGDRVRDHLESSRGSHGLNRRAR
jgi:hypothetical protein